MNDETMDTAPTVAPNGGFSRWRPVLAVVGLLLFAAALIGPIGFDPDGASDVGARKRSRNATKLDGLDSTQFVRQGITAYEVDQEHSAPGNDAAIADVFCDEGDLLQAGGYFGLSPNGVIAQNAPSNGPTGWRVQLRSTDAQSSSVTVRILSFDFPPLRS